MNKKFLFYLFFFLLFWAIGNAYGERKYLKIDGYEWTNFPRSLKLGFVMGWSECYGIIIVGIPVVITRTSKIEREVLGIKTEDKLKKNKKLIEGFTKEKGLELVDLNFDQVVDTIDKIYSDPRVKTWEIRDVMPLVRGRLKEGWTEKELDEVIAYLIRARKRVEKWEEYISMSETDRLKFDEELMEPNVWKELMKYRFEP